MLAASWALAVAAPPKPGSQPMVPAEQQQEQQQQIPPPAEDGCRGIKMEEIADAWFEAINPLDAGDAAATCVPALVIAAGCSFNTASCPNLFDPDVKSGISNGFWLIPPSAAGAWDPTPKKQAEAVYKYFLSDAAPTGCASPGCKPTNCGEPHYNIGQFDGVMEHHRFCRGHWMADTPFYLEAADAAGGIDKMKEVCGAAKKKADQNRPGMQGNSPEAKKARAEQDKLAAFIRKQIGTIWVADVAETMSTMLTRAIENVGINTLKDAAEKIGKGDISKAEEVVKKAGLQNPGMSNDLEPALLKEWMEGAADLLLAVNANKAVAAFAAYSASEAAREAASKVR